MSSSSVSSVSSLQILEVKRQKLADKLRKIDEKIRAEQRRAEMMARRRQARDTHYSLHRVDDKEGKTKPVPKRKRSSSEDKSEEEEENEEPLQKKQRAARKVGYTLRKYFRSIPSEERKRVREAQQDSLVPSKKLKLAEDVTKDASADADEVFLPTVPSTSSDAGPIPTPSPTPSIASLISLLSLTSLASLSTTQSPPASLPAVASRSRGRPKKKMCTRARDASGRFLPGTTRVRPVVCRKRRTELQMLQDYLN